MSPQALFSPVYRHFIKLLERLPLNLCYEARDIPSCTGVSAGSADGTGKDSPAFSGNSWMLAVHSLWLSASFDSRHSTHSDQPSCRHTTDSGHTVSCCLTLTHSHSLSLTHTHTHTHTFTGCLL